MPKLNPKIVKTSELIDRAIKLTAKLYEMNELDVQLAVRFNDMKMFMVWCDRAVYNVEDTDYVRAEPIDVSSKGIMAEGKTINEALVRLVNETSLRCSYKFRCVC